MKTYLVTGATSGLGLEIVKQLSRERENRIVMLVRNMAKGNELKRIISGDIEVHQVDLSNLTDISNFTLSWNHEIDGLINNAGVQLVNGTRFTPDGYEETMAVNHLAPFMLTIGLKSCLKGGRVLFIGSGTHNPGYPLAKPFGFRGAQYTSIPDLLEGKTTAENIQQANRDRYSTSKLLNIITAVELSERFTDFSSYVLDPGLMPGTGLAREQGKVMQILWNNVMPVLGHLMPDTSNPVRSARTAAWIMTEPGLEKRNGSIFSYNGKPYGYVWDEMVRNVRIRHEIFEDSMKVLQKHISINN